MGMDNTQKFEIDYLLKRKKVIVRDIFLRKKNVVPSIDVQSSDQMHSCKDGEKYYKPVLTFRLPHLTFLLSLPNK